MTLEEIRTKVENDMIPAKAKEFEKRTGKTLNEFFADVEADELYGALVRVVLSAYYANE